MKQDPFCVLQDVIVPEANDAITCLFKLRGAPGVPFLIVLPAIHFDDQSALEAEEICDERPYRNLPPELKAVQLTRPELLPQEPLGVRLIAP